MLVKPHIYELFDGASFKYIMKKNITILATGMSFMLPLISLAETVSTDADSLIQKVAGWIDILTPIVVALALLYFFYGLAMFILKSGDEDKRKEAKSIMIYGIIALFVMVSVWGLVSILGNTIFGTSTTGGTENIPYVDTTI